MNLQNLPDETGLLQQRITLPAFLLTVFGKKEEREEEKKLEIEVLKEIGMQRFVAIIFHPQPGHSSGGFIPKLLCGLRVCKMQIICRFTLDKNNNNNTHMTLCPQPVITIVKSKPS